MSWKNDIITLMDQQTKIIKLLQVLQGQTAINSKRIEAMRVLMDEQMRNQSRSADRMADRMIEMAMVNSGKATEAASHRRTLGEQLPEANDLWQDSPETAWPPPGHDAIAMP